MGLIKNKSVSMYVDGSTAFREIEPAGTRCKLYGIQVGVYSVRTNRLYAQAILPNNGRNVQLRTGSSTGSILFDVAIPFVGASYYYVGELPYVFNLDPNYVLFDDGIFMDEISDATADSGAGSSVAKLFGTNVQLSLFYEV